MHFTQIYIWFCFTCSNQLIVNYPLLKAQQLKEENYPIRLAYAQGFMARRVELRQTHGIRLEEKTIFIG